MTDAADVFNTKDFESIRLVVHFQNVTTRTEVKGGEKTGLLEIGNKMLVIELPAKSCNVKHNVMLKICQVERGKEKDPKKKPKKEKELLSVTGKVWDIEELDDESVRVAVECVQYDEKSWNDLLNLFSNRQAEIEKFLAAARGY